MESEDFVRSRIALLGKALFALSVAGTVVQTVAFAVAGQYSGVWGPTGLLSLAGTATAAALWLACRNPSRSRRFAYTAEAVALIASMALAATMGRYINMDLFPALVEGLDASALQGSVLARLVESLQRYVGIIMVLAATQTMVMRAAVVPSRMGHTIALAAGMGVPLLVISGWGLSPSIPDRELTALLSSEARTGMVGMLTVWWSLTIAVCAITSRIIHQLRTEVTKARKLGQYELMEKLGEGGMGQVFRARHAMMRRPTAIKLLAADAATGKALARFEREVQLTASLTHPNTITIFDYGRTPDGAFYYAMELLDGASLQEVVDTDGPQPASRVLRIVAMVAGALSEAHSVGLVHRDIKPANILLCEQGGEPDVAKVLDFGLVKEVEAEPDPSVSTVGSITGTPLYLSPEAVRAPDSLDGRADIYALGAVAYFLVTGRPVFDGASVVEICGHHILSEPESPSKRLGKPVPGDLEALILSCLRKDPKERPATAREVVDRANACAEANDWSEDKAKAWWTRCKPTIQAARATLPPITSGATVAVAVS